MQKCIVFGAGEEVKVQNYSITLSSVVQVIQYVKSLYIGLHYFPI